MMNQRDKIIAEAKTWLGTPYHHRGAVKGAGVDCAQILIEVYSACGLVPKFDVGEYPPDWHMHRSEERYLGWIKKYAHRVDTPQRGDITLFKFGRCVSHGAIVLDYPLLIHSYFRQGCVYASATDIELAGRLDSFWSLF